MKRSGCGNTRTCVLLDAKKNLVPRKDLDQSFLRDANDLRDSSTIFCYSVATTTACYNFDFDGGPMPIVVGQPLAFHAWFQIPTCRVEFLLNPSQMCKSIWVLAVKSRC